MKSFGLYVAMVVLQLSYAVSYILLKASFARGLDRFVFIAYRHIIGLFILGPLACILERKRRPSLSCSVFAKIFVLATLGTTIYLNALFAGLAHTSPTIASALDNVIPSFTFLMAVLLRMEKVKIRSGSGQAKVVGTIMCVGGSLALTFWNGGYQIQLKGFAKEPLINIYGTNSINGAGSDGDHYLRHHHHHHHQQKDDQNWFKGVCLVLLSTIAWSGWLVLQGTVTKVYPAQMSLNALICFIASLQSSFLALFFARDPLLWKLEWNLQLLTIIYSGVVITAFAYYIQTWCISYKGPVFVSAFTPLCALIIAVFSAIALAERLHLGSLVGACLIILGLYIVLWGKKADNFASTGNHEEDETNVNGGVILQISENI